MGSALGNFLPRYRQRVERSLGSGVIVDKVGHIVTNHHVVAKCRLDQGATGGRSRGRCPDRRARSGHRPCRPADRFDALPSWTFGRSDRLRPGDVVLAIGDPIGLSQSVTHGIVSATGREQLGIATFEDFIQTDAAINFGNSGGALIDTSRRARPASTPPSSRRTWASKASASPFRSIFVRGVLDDIIAHGRVIRGWMASARGRTETQAKSLGLRAQASSSQTSTSAVPPSRQAYNPAISSLPSTRATEERPGGARQHRIAAAGYRWSRFAHCGGDNPSTRMLG